MLKTATLFTVLETMAVLLMCAGLNWIIGVLYHTIRSWREFNVINVEICSSVSAVKYPYSMCIKVIIELSYNSRRVAKMWTLLRPYM